MGIYSYIDNNKNVSRDETPENLSLEREVIKYAK